MGGDDRVYEVFEHTADLGLRVEAPDLERLFAEAARALSDVLVEDLETVRPVQTMTIRLEGRLAGGLEGDALGDLMLDWLNEVLYLFETRHVLLSVFDVTMTDRGLEAIARGELHDETRHHLDHEVKAITYHGLAVRRAETGWRAEIIVDI
jgi:SHS2 domain-containing protein